MSQPCSSLPHRQSSEFPSWVNPSSPNKVWAKFPTWQVHQSCHWLHSVLEQDLKFVWFLFVNDTRKWVRSFVMLSLKTFSFLCPDTTSWLFFRSLLVQAILPFFCLSLTCNTIILHQLIFFYSGSFAWVFQVEFYFTSLSSVFPVCPSVLFLFPLRWPLHPWYVLTKMRFYCAPQFLTECPDFKEVSTDYILQMQL